MDLYIVISQGLQLRHLELLLQHQLQLLGIHLLGILLAYLQLLVLQLIDILSS
jgi:hypothetical protein